MYTEISLVVILLVALSAASVLCANIKFNRKKKILQSADSEMFITEKIIEGFDYLPVNRVGGRKEKEREYRLSFYHPICH